MLITRLNIGGPAVQVISLAREMNRTDLRVTLACGQVGADEGDMRYLAEQQGVQPIYVPALGRRISPLKDFSALIALIKLIKKLNPDCLHTHTAKAGALGRLAASIVNLARPARKKIRIIHTYHGHIFNSYFNSVKTTVFQWVERLLSRVTDRIVAISPSQKEDICYRYKVAPESKVGIIPLGFDLSRFENRDGVENDKITPWFPGLPSNTFLVGMVGRLTAVKNPRMLFAVAKRLKRMGRGAEFGFVFVGDGELNVSLKREAVAARLEKQVCFAGWREDIPAIYNALDAVLLTSLNEGTPVTLIEAMAARKMVVATDVGGVRDLMGREEKRTLDRYRIMQNGVLVASRDVEAMAHALVYVKDERELFEKKAGMIGRDIVNKYSIGRIVDDLTQLYLSCGLAG